MAEDDVDETDLKTTSFRAEREKLEHLKHLINRRNFARGPGADEITMKIGRAHV